MENQKKIHRVGVNFSDEQYHSLKKRQASSNAPNLSQFIRFIVFPKDDKIIYRNLDEEKILINLNNLSIKLNQLKIHLNISITILEGQLKDLEDKNSELPARLIDCILETNELLLELKKLFNKIVLTWSQNYTKPAIL